MIDQENHPASGGESSSKFSEITGETGVVITALIIVSALIAGIVQFLPVMRVTFIEAFAWLFLCLPALFILLRHPRLRPLSEKSALLGRVLTFIKWVFGVATFFISGVFGWYVSSMLDQSMNTAKNHDYEFIRSLTHDIVDDFKGLVQFMIIAFCFLLMLDLDRILLRHGFLKSLPETWSSADCFELRDTQDHDTNTEKEIDGLAKFISIVYGILFLVLMADLSGHILNGLADLLKLTIDANLHP